MKTQKKLALLAFFILLIPSSVLAKFEMDTGYDLYHNLKRLDNPQNFDDASAGFSAMGYFKGCLDGLILMQDTQYNQMFPSNLLTEKEREKISKEVNFHRLNTPKKGIAVGQMILIYKRFCEKHPEKLNNTARLCVYMSIVNAFGWK